MKPVLDILMPVHDNLAWVQVAVSAIERFTKQPWRLVLIDNASQTSEMQAWLDERNDDGASRLFHANKVWGGVRVLRRSKNDSFSESINAGLALTKPDAAPYVVFLNSDVIVTPGWDVVMTTEASNPNVGMTGGSSGAYPPGQNRGVNFLIFYAVCARREVVDTIGPLDSATCPGWGGSEDLDYSWRIVDHEVNGRRPWRLMSTEAVVYHGTSQTYASSGVSAQKKADLEEANRERLKKKVGLERFNAGLKTVPIVKFGRISRTEMLIDSFVDCVIGMMQVTGRRVAWQGASVTRSLIDMARNAVCQSALESNADYVLFIDDDMVFNPDLLLRLLDHDKDVVSAWCYQRGEPHDPVCFEWVKDSNGYVPMRNAANTGLRKVDAVGFGAVLIKTSVLKGMKKPWFKFERFGEDIGFCDEARKAGFEVYCDTDLEIGHLAGRVEINNAYVHQYREMKGDVIK